MNKPLLLTGTLSAMLIGAATVGWTGTALAEEAAQTGAVAPATEWYPTQGTTAQGTAPATAQTTAPATAPPAAQVTTQGTAPDATQATAQDAAQATAQDTTTGAAPDATQATAQDTTQATAPDTAQGTAPDTAQDTRSYRDRGRYGWRRGHNGYAEQRKALTRARRDNMEQWRSMRRWWKNPAAEDRRQWNKARSRAHRDMAEARRDYNDMNRPYGNYGYGGRRSYRSGPWY